MPVIPALRDAFAPVTGGEGVVVRGGVRTVAGYALVP